jgi:radical SAM protein with 4Fe4S-binding SPASM domain
MAIIEKFDKKNRFVSRFNTKDGFYMRTGVLDDKFVDTGVDPFMTTYPELCDIGIMGSCLNGSLGLCKQAGVHCYQSGGSVALPNMLLSDYKKIIDECKGKTFQVALGGRGDPDQHEDFKEIIEYTVAANIVPNFTTSGIRLDQSKIDIMKGKAGACAVSWYRNEHTYRAIDLLLTNDIITNIHYVLSKDSIDEAMDRIKNDDFPKGINAVVFLLHKPVGSAKKNLCLSPKSRKIKKFFKLIDTCKPSFKIGFDSCTVPGILNYCKNINEMSVDTCEGARWSMYIGADMIALPCSFDQKKKWGFNIKEDTIQNAWDSPQFEDFRNHFRTACPDCPKKEGCMGGCPITPNVVLCKDKK